MYESFYGLKEKPFTLLPDPSFLYLGKKHAMALAMLQYSLASRAGITVLSGEVGSGKTTLIRHLLGHVDKNVAVGLISNTHRNFGEFLQWVSLAFGLEFDKKSKVALYQQLIDFFLDRYKQGLRSVLIIDEAQNLSLETLEEIRLLSNINVDKHHILQIILAGQPELRQKLRRPELEQFIQRVAVAYYLPPLTPEETDSYIIHRLTLAGGDPNLFDTGARRFIHHQSGGIPRLINILCDTALVYGFADRKRQINTETIYSVVQDKIKGGLLATRKREKQEVPTRAPASSERSPSALSDTNVVPTIFAKPVK
jgi:type II secretory pathway predicted ATPase ExeA